MTAATNQVEELLRDLVRIPSVNPRDGAGDGGETAVAAYVRDWLAERGVPAELHEVLPGRCNVVAVVPGRSEEAVLLETHLDTVETDGMTVGPYDGEVGDGRLYGRGACDAKGPLAAFLLAVAELAAGEPPPRTVVLAGVCDEEHAYRGVLGLLDTLRGRVVVGAVVGEPTALVPAVAHKGVVRYTVRTTGRAGHSSRPEEAVNAITLMGPVLAHLADRPPAVPPHPLLGPATRSVTRIRGGTGPNTIAGSCEADVDRRTLPGEDPDTVWRDDRAELAVLGAEVDPPFTVDPALDTRPDAEIVTALCRALAGHGRPAEARGMPFGTDASKLARAGVPSVVFGPGSVADAHAAAESVALADVELAARIVVAAVRGMETGAEERAVASAPGEGGPSCG
ncbi:MULTISPECIES: M20/M25/M40 family metallo-hydrolase [Streptomyces]|uniref:M20/M25/M40 family metallo-hydrolase n=1 Tax=Streptomyces griseiscabiei TaxID=2993540 RepID=A0ABU4LCV0_9ACTN|nr:MULTISPECIES: M20/M25/M40 family metallo-hydrolase [Streptomyces]MBZ3904103.1 M20/M25/M40 family metallo-hydrolase [Streptomyces griseiscabiei]MDX2913029.1 M20/M25/M40 family metallo-hydrolase [Streptomyces griseiscabiei]